MPSSGRIPTTGVWFVTFAASDPSTVSQWRIKGDGTTSIAVVPSRCFGSNSGGPPLSINPAVDSGRAIELALPMFVQTYGSEVSAGSGFYVRYGARPDDGRGMITVRPDSDFRRRCPIDKVWLDEQTGEIIAADLTCLQSPNMGRFPTPPVQAPRSQDAYGFRIRPETDGSGVSTV